MRRRRDVPDRLREPARAFAGMAGELERAKAELLLAIPAARTAAVPLAEALLAFREGLDRAAAGMDAWRTPELDAEWARCAAGIDAARTAEVALRLRPGNLPHDQLLFALQDLIAPLQAFEDAARRWDSLRAIVGGDAPPGW
ncbi:MAG: hypothetical protein WD770_05070 [Actinomycetota bacterium]